MVIMTDDDDIERKPAKYTLLLAEQLNEAIKYLREKNPNQAEIMGKQFFKTVRLLETMPGIGTMCQNGMRKFKLGKFRYNIYYRIKADYISILGIWHTSRGTDFVEP